MRLPLAADLAGFVGLLQRLNLPFRVSEEAGEQVLWVPDESLAEAALRETREETGWDVRLTAFVGAYQWKAPETGRHYLRFAFAAEPLRHDPARRLDEGIVQAFWVPPSELLSMRERHRSPLVAKVVEDFLAGRRHPLELAQQLA